MSKRVKDRVVLGIPHPTSAMSVPDPNLFPLFGKPIPEIQFYEHNLNCPMTLLAVFEMEKPKRKEYFEMLNTRFGFELQDYMEFFRVDKATMYNILTSHDIKLKSAGGMSGSQAREWKKFLAKNWEQPCRPIEVSKPIIDEIQKLMGPKIDGKVPEVTDAELKNLYIPEETPPTSPEIPSESTPEPSAPLNLEESEETAMEAKEIVKKIVKKIVVSDFNDPDVELRLNLRLTQSAAEELLNYLFEQKYTGSGKIKTISVVLPPITPSAAR